MKNTLVTNILEALSGKFGTIFIQLVTTIVLARYLDPSAFGIVALCSIFLSISEMLIDSGMAGSIIFHENVKKIELHTLFWSNFLISVIIYLILFFTSSSIADFYNVDILDDIIKVIGISIVVHSLCIIQSAMLSKELKFKLQSKILILSALISSVVVIILAVSGWGVWALVAQPILIKIFQVVFFYVYGDYKPRFAYSLKSLERHWKFGSRLLGSSMLKLIYDNIYVQVIGKVINISDAGYYSQAKRFNDIPTKLIAFPLERVIFPNLVKSSNKVEKMKRLNNVFSFLVIPGLVLASLISDELILLLLGEKWLDSGWMLSFLFLGGIGASLEALNRNFMKSSGKINILLRFDVYKRILNFTIILIAMYWSIQGILIAFIINGFINWLINSYALNLCVDYKFKNQVLNVLEIIVLAFIPFLLMFFIFREWELKFYYSLVLKIFIYLTLYGLLIIMFKRQELLYYIKLIRNKKIG